MFWASKPCDSHWNATRFALLDTSRRTSYDYFHHKLTTDFGIS
jgi:hypothetical protein